VTRKLKLLCLYLLKATGCFRIARFLTRPALRILCYHGAALIDEHVWNPGTFMSPATFQRRMRLLKGLGFAVLPLADAARRFREGTLPPAAVVITIDDGWLGTYRHMVPVLTEHGLPASLYVTTYYVSTRTRVFNVALSYLHWKAGQRFELAQVLNNGESLPPAERDALLDRLGAEVVGPAWSAAPLFRLVTDDQIAEMVRCGVDIQLHTHRHRLPTDEPGLREELLTNARLLGPLVREPLKHLCYPSGEWEARHLPLIRAFGIETATTTDSGLNWPHAEPLLLSRFLDSETKTDIEFEAELCGVIDLGKRVVGWFKPTPAHRPHDQVAA
jgi:peptidoglycan/xylan/chitin deacetylase (PgdA/CDA1 family)